MKQSQASLLNHLEAWVRTEIAQQEKLAELIDNQIAAIQNASSEEFEQCTLAVDQALNATPERHAQRDRILTGFERLWDVPASAMTLRSIAARVGQEGERLLALRDELRERSAVVLKQGRKAQALFNLHRSLFREVIETLLTDENGSPFDQEGALVDASA